MLDARFPLNLWVTIIVLASMCHSYVRHFIDNDEVSI